MVSKDDWGDAAFVFTQPPSLTSDQASVTAVFPPELKSYSLVITSAKNHLSARCEQSNDAVNFVLIMYQINHSQ